MSLRIRVQIIGGNDIVTEGQNDMKYIEFYQKIQTYLSSTRELKITKNTFSLILNRDRNKTLQELGITNNCYLQVEIVTEILYILAKYGEMTETIEINDSEMKLSEFANLLKNRFNVRNDIVMWKEDNNNKKMLDLSTQGDFSLKILNFTSSTTVRVLKDEIRVMIDINGDEIYIIDAKKSDTFGIFYRGICEKIGKSRIHCMLGSRYIGNIEQGNMTLGVLGIEDNSRITVLDHFPGGLIDNFYAYFPMNLFP